ncbi:MAG: type VI secretion system tip protein VgrG [Bacteroidetes bacterium]|nr:MAG: type VI secretion system tip protein VgrG [Bacteroidota bacterium]
MMASRTIPTVSAVAGFKFTVNGSVLPNTTAVLSVQVQHAINKLPSATLIMLDNQPGGQPFALSNGNQFLPGATIEIAAGDANEQVPIFSGIVVKHQLRLRSNTGPELHVQCKHGVSKATLARTNKVFLNATDADNIAAILQPYAGDIPVMVDATAPIHPEMVQFNTTDWDFVVSRAQATGLVVMIQPDVIEVKKPVVEGTPTYTINYGSSIIDLDAEIDGRLQYSAVTANAWSPAQQAMVQQEGSAESSGLGNLPATSVAQSMEAPPLNLYTGAALPEPELKAWADASLQKQQLSKVRGKAQIDGMADYRLGGLVAVAGMGNRFVGNAWISAIGHQYDTTNGWKTHLQFGDNPAVWLEQNTSAHAPSAAGLLPAVPGLQVGIVVLLEDPMGEGRVQVSLPAMGMGTEAVWARMAQADAGQNRGLFFRPEIGDEVVLGFLSNDPRYPVVLGGLHSSALPPPFEPTDDNHIKGLLSRQGIKLEDMNQNMIEMTPAGIKIQTAAKLELAAAQLVLGASGTLGISASGSAEMKASGGMKLQASGTLDLKGAIININ